MNKSKLITVEIHFHYFFCNHLVSHFTLLYPLFILFNLILPKGDFKLRKNFKIFSIEFFHLYNSR